MNALIARWREKNTGNLIKQSEAYAESLAEAMLNVFDCWVNKDLFDSQFEFAVRSWALISLTLSTQQHVMETVPKQSTLHTSLSLSLSLSLAAIWFRTP